MRNLVVLFSLILLDVSLQLQVNEDCKTPSGFDGICKPLSQCDIIKPIVTLARQRNATALKLAVAYQCGYEREPLVCCDLLDLSSIFTTVRTRIEVRKPIVLGNLNSTDLPDRSVCGVTPNENDRIWGGEQTELGEFPWAAALEFKKRADGEVVGVRCGGALINYRYVVTAAHCILDNEFRIFQVRLGEWNIKTDPDCYELDLPNPECADRVEIYGIEKELPHEFYAKRDSSNDIGLLKLDKNVEFTKFIRPICLPPPGLPAVKLGTYMTVVGWGLTEHGSTSDIKLKVSVPLVSNRICKQKLQKTISSNHYCAGGELDKDACRGDSGGPLMRTFQNTATDPEQWFLEGIVGSGLGCGLRGTPAIYIRVTEYTRWIVNKLAEQRQNNINPEVDELISEIFGSQNS